MSDQQVNLGIALARFWSATGALADAWERLDPDERDYWLEAVHEGMWPLLFVAVATHQRLTAEV